MLAEPSDNAGARDTFCRYTTDETPEAMPLTQSSASCLHTQLDTARRDGDLGWAHTSDYVQVSEEPSLEEATLHVLEFKKFCDLRDLRKVRTENDLSYQPQF